MAAIAPGFSSSIVVSAIIVVFCVSIVGLSSSVAAAVAIGVVSSFSSMVTLVVTFVSSNG